MLALSRALPLFLLGCSVASCGNSDDGNGQGSVLTSGVSILTPSNFVVTSAGVVYTNTDGNGVTTLDAVPLAGGTAKTLLTVPSMQSIAALASDGTTVDAFVGSSIESVPVAGGQVSTLVPQSELPTPPSSQLLLAGSTLYWIALDPETEVSGSIWSAQAANVQATAAPLQSDLPGPCALAADAANLYWLDCVAKTLSSLPLTAAPDSAANVLATTLQLEGGENASAPLAVAAGLVFWGDTASGSISSVPAAGGAVSILASHPGAIPVQIVADAATVYWLEEIPQQSPSSVYSVGAGGGAVSDVLTSAANGDSGYNAIGLDASYLYYQDNEGGTIKRLAR